MPNIKMLSEIEKMRTSGRILAEVLEVLRKAVRAGITTAELDSLAAVEVAARGAEAAFLGHRSGHLVFPAHLCTSVNDEIVHGIPGERELQEGDIIGLDFGVRYQGMLTDGAITVPVGQISAEAQRLLDVTRLAREAGIAQVRDGARVGDVSAAIEQVLHQGKLGIVKELVGHGVGHSLWEEPQVPNFGKAGRGPVLRAGMTIAIEPMASLGRGNIGVDNDGWTIRTVDGSLAAQFEHTVLVTESGAEILTQV